MAVVTPEIQNEVAELYIGFFGRAPDAIGFGYWAQDLANGATVYDVAANFARTPEFVSEYGGLTPEQQVDKIYLNVLNRTADAAGRSYWAGEIASGTPVSVVVYQVVYAAFSGSAVSDPDPVVAAQAVLDQQLVQNKVTVGQYFAIDLASNNTALAATAFDPVTADPASVTAAENYLNANSGATYTLTTGIDNYTGTPNGDTFNAVLDYSAGAFQPVNTLTNADSLDGRGGYNTLNAQLYVADVSPTALTNIQSINLTTVNSDSSINLVTATEAEQVTNLASSARLTVTGIAAGAALNVTNTGNQTDFTYVSAVDEADLTIQQVAGKINVSNADTLNITSKGLVANEVNLNDAQTGLTVAGATDLALTGISKVTSLDASTFTGDLTASLTAVATVIGGLGDDVITLAAGGSLVGGDGNDELRIGTGNATVDAGKGNDDVYGGQAGEDFVDLGDGTNQFYAGGALTDVIGGAGNDFFAFDSYLTVNDTIDGGAGVNTLRLAADTAETASKVALDIENIQTLEIYGDVLVGGEFNATIDITNIDSTIDTIINSADVSTGAKYIVNGGETTIKQYGVAFAGNLTIEAGGDTSTDFVALNNLASSPTDITNGKDITLLDVETLSLGTGASNTQQTIGTLTIDGLNPETAVNLNVSGDNAVNIASVSSGTNETLTIDLSGLTAQEAGTTTAYIASVSTGGSVSIIGSEGDDSLYGDTDGSNTIDGGAGADEIHGGSAADSLLGGAGDDFITANSGNDTVRGGAGNDTIVVDQVGKVVVDAGADDDLVLVGNTLSIGDSIDGGTGTNTFVESTALLQNFAGVTNFQTLVLDAAITQNLAKFTGNTTWEEIHATVGANTVTNAAQSVQTIALHNSVDDFTLSRIGSQTGNVVVHALQNQSTAINSLTLDDETLIEFDQGAIESTPALFAVNVLNAESVTSLTISGEQDTRINSVNLGGTERTVAVDASAAVGTVYWDGTSAVAAVTQELYGSLTAASTLIGGAGNDSITFGNAETGNATDAGEGDNSVIGGTGADVINAGAGDDTISSGEGDDIIAAGNGDNTITAGNGNVSVTSGSGADSITVGDGNNTVLSAAGEDTITAGNGTDTITAGQDADSVALGADSGSNRVIQGAADGVVASATAIANTREIADGDTLTFGNGLDIVTNFQATGTGYDTLGLAVYGSVPTNLLGQADALEITENYYLSGNYNGLTGVFTVADNGADTIIVQGAGGVTLQDNDSIVLLQGVNGSALTDQNFVDPLNLQAVYRSDNQYLIGGPAEAAITIAATSGSVTGGGAVDYVGNYSQALIEVIDASFVNFTGGTSGATINVNGAVSTNLQSVLGTAADDTIIQTVASFGAADSTVDGGAGTKDALQFTSVNTALTLEDVSNKTGAQITGIEAINLKLGVDATDTLTLGSSLTSAQAVENTGSKKASVDLGTGGTHTYTSSVSGDTVTLGLTGQSATFGADGSYFIANAVAGSTVEAKGAGTNTITANTISALSADYTGNGISDTVVLENGASGSVTTGTLTGIELLDAGQVGKSGVTITLSKAVSSIAGNTSVGYVNYQTAWDELGGVKNIANDSALNDFNVSTTAGAANAITLDISGITISSGNVNNWDFSKTTGTGLTVKATNAEVVNAKNFTGTADTTDTLEFSDGFDDTIGSQTSSIANVSGFATIAMANNAPTSLIVETADIGLNFIGGLGAKNRIYLEDGATGSITAGKMTNVAEFSLGQVGQLGADVTLGAESEGVEVFSVDTSNGNATLNLSAKQLDFAQGARDKDFAGTNTFAIKTTATAGGQVDLTGFNDSYVDTFDFSASTSAVQVTADSDLVNDTKTSFMGSADLADTLTITTDVQGATLNAVSGFEQIVLQGTKQNAITTKETLVTTGGQVEISAGTTGGLQFDGSAETDGGNFKVTGSTTDANTLTGGAGADTLIGGDAADEITGKQGADSLTGGDGADEFKYESGATGRTLETADTITDFLTASDTISVGIVDPNVTPPVPVQPIVDIVDGENIQSLNDFSMDAGLAFGGGKNVFVAYNVALISSGNALVAIDENASGTFNEGDSLIVLTGINQVSEISTQDFIL